MGAERATAGRVLIVDDDEAVRILLTRYLEIEGFQVDEVSDGSAAMAAIASSKPDLVLLDLTLPAQDGLDILGRLRRDSDVPVILLTARGSEADRILGLKLGRTTTSLSPFPRESWPPGSARYCAAPAPARPSRSCSSTAWLSTSAPAR